MRKIKKLTAEEIQCIEDEVLMLLFAERDCYLNWLNAGQITKLPKSFCVAASGGGYHAEAFGIMRTLVTMGYCYFGADNTPENRINAKWWFDQLELKCLQEETRLTLLGGYKHYFLKHSANMRNNLNRTDKLKKIASI